MTASLGTILLVEDNPGDARLATECIRERFGFDCRVQRAATLQAALEWLGHSPPDLILLDLSLPDSAGLEGLRRLAEQAPQTPIVVLTANKAETLVLDALREGADEYLSKQDLSERTLTRSLRQALERKRQSNQARWDARLILELAAYKGDAVLKVGPEGRVLACNPTAEQMLGLTAPGANDGGLVGQNLHDFMTAPSQSTLEDLLTAATLPKSGELEVRRKDGAPCWVLVAAGPAAPYEQSNEIVLMLTSITAQKLVEQALTESRQQVEQEVHEKLAHLTDENQELMALQYALAHDLQSPLMGIIGLTQLVLAEESVAHSDETQRRLFLVEQSAQAMNSLIADALTLARLERKTLCKTEVNLSDIARLLSQRMTATLPVGAAVLDIEEDIWAYADAALVTAILENLLSNALKYASHEVVRRVQFGRLPRVNETAQYYVVDNGIGFSKEEAAQLFKPFRRLPSASGFPGTGLGLTSVKKLVERHGGRVWATGSLGQGAAFYFDLGTDSGETAP